jgi:hypothetical protein
MDLRQRDNSRRHAVFAPKTRHNLGRDARFANSTRASQRHEWRIGIAKHREKLFDVHVAPDQPGERRRNRWQQDASAARARKDRQTRPSWDEVLPGIEPRHPPAPKTLKTTSEVSVKDQRRCARDDSQWLTIHPYVADFGEIGKV